MDILAHRANLHGPDHATENSLDACAAALAQGFGLEIDVRRDPSNRFYISHDPARWTQANALETYASVFAAARQQRIAVNAKELGYLRELAELIETRVFGPRALLFDFELLEPATPGASQRAIRAIASGTAVPLASRLSDRGEPVAQCLGIPGEVAWADEFDRFWLTRAEVEALRVAGREVVVISPELHGFDHAARRRRWADFKTWGVDCICTDFPIEAREFFT